MSGSNLTHRGMVGGLPVSVSAPPAVSSDRFIVGAWARSARKIPVLVVGSFLGAWRRVSGLSKRKGYGAYQLTPGGLGERSHRLSNDENFETHINDISKMISRMSSNGNVRGRFVMRRSALVKSETHHFF
jgi:hypothetical protein